MSGFALLFDSHTPIPDRDWEVFRDAVARYKGLHKGLHKELGKELGASFQEAGGAGARCAVAKFDTPSSLHRGITVDEHSGSWLLAVGTVLDTDGANAPDGSLAPLLDAYLERGAEAFRHLDGHFALVVYDGPADKLLVVSGPLGLVSVFLGRRGSRTYVATSALAVAEAVQATPAEYGVYLYLTVGSVYGRTTLWQEVERLPAATVLEITAGGHRESVYWSPMVDEDVLRLSLDESVDYALALLSRLIRLHLAREGRPWADLTGGFDSRLVTMMMDHVGVPFRASCQGPPDSPDVRISSRIARRLGWAYHHHILPETWGQERCAWLSRALGKGDGHVDVFKLSAVLWDQAQRAPVCPTSIWGLGGELWRGTIWKQEFLNVGRTPDVNYDRLLTYRVISCPNPTLFRDPGRIAWIREQVKALLRSVGERYAGWPNTVKLDAIFAYKVTGLTGGHLSAVMGMQRAIAPLDFRESVVGAISTHFRWRQHSRLVRLLMERVAPQLAAFETTDGGPALPMRLTNLYKFTPYWSAIGRQLVRKASQAVLGRSVLPPARDEFAGYPLARWRRETLEGLAPQRLLDPGHMHSGALYDAEKLMDFVARAGAQTPAFDQETLLSRILTVEMAFRAVGTAL